MRETFPLRYVGPRSSRGMEASNVSAAIDGFAGVSLAAGRAVYGNHPEIAFRVREVRGGSLTIEFLMEIAGTAQSLTGVLPGLSSVGDVLNFLKTWFEILKHLRGEPPVMVQKVAIITLNQQRGAGGVFKDGDF